MGLTSEQAIADIEHELGLSDELLLHRVKEQHVAKAAGKTIEKIVDERQEIARLLWENQDQWEEHTKKQ